MPRLSLPTAPAPAGCGRPAAPTLADVGGLSDVSKMPWLSYNLPADQCNVGSRLRGVPGSTCHGCYALKGNYTWKNVKLSLANRMAKLKADPERWADAMTVLITRAARRFRPTPSNPWPAFRWHDSGDLQGVWHLAAIARVCRDTRRVTLADGSVKAVRHWLPTREYALVSEYLDAGHALPGNLTVRLSAHMVDGPAPLALARKYGITVSTVHTPGDTVGDAPYHYPDAAPCKAASPGLNAEGKPLPVVCGSCRACWSGKVAHVSYAKH